ncbi:PulJ/GspJ family protein [Bacillus marasmi]|uniref:PulJ/GspJ family protein n=1 Tax=Bacillus marasmi TaxID=1926279 RepID=UPI0011C8F4C2|nr:prepilin-type N-terminal cleavage/methylation domain-containing protein [Bacillus marasmi]
MYHNEKGITLLEVLATVTILSIIGMGIWNVFFQGYQFSSKTIKKSQIQQEANVAITSMMNFHRGSANSYQITVSNCEIKLANSSDTLVLKNPQICLKSNFSGNKNVNPDIENLNFTLIAADKNDEQNKVTIETVLSRLKSGD